MPLEMRFAAGKWSPALICETCHEPLTVAAPGHWTCLENGGQPTLPELLFRHDACEARHSLGIRSGYEVRARPLSDLAGLFG